MHSQSLRNSYTESGVLVYSPPEPSAAQGGRNASTTRIPRKRSGLGRAKVPLLFLGLLVVAAVYGLKILKGVQEDAENTKVELAAALAQVESAEKRAELAEGLARESSAEAAEREESLAKITRDVEQKDQAAAELKERLQSLLKEGQGEVTLGKDGSLSLQLVDKVLFRSGEADLTKRGQRVMARVGTVLEEMKNKQVWVQGHTDAVPVREDNENFSSNWELSAARALTVVHYLQDESQLDPRRLAAAAFGSHRPASRRKKSKNRRIEIVLFPMQVKLRR